MGIRRCATEYLVVKYVCTFHGEEIFEHTKSDTKDITFARNELIKGGEVSWSWISYESIVRKRKGFMSARRIGGGH